MFVSNSIDKKRPERAKRVAFIDFCYPIVEAEIPFTMLKLY